MSWLLRKKTSKDHPKPNASNPEPREYTFEEINTATNYFNPDRFISEDNYGKNFNGSFDGRAVVIKCLNLNIIQGTMEARRAASTYLWKLRHNCCHLVTLVGHCCEDNHWILVYEFTPRGSLGSSLFKVNGKESRYLSWRERLEVASGLAEGLQFLEINEHSVATDCINTSNIFLDTGCKSKLIIYFKPHLDGQADAGPSLLTISDQGHNVAMDVLYRFAVVFLELLTGLPSAGGQDFSEWYRWHSEDIIDNRIAGQYPYPSARIAAKLACGAAGLGETFTIASVLQNIKTLKSLASAASKPKPMPNGHYGDAN